MKILHLIDDWVFADGSIEVFKTFNVENRFIILRSNDNKKLDKIRNAQDVVIVQINTDEYENLLHEHWDVVWVHGYRQEKGRFVARIDGRVAVVWSTWGFDYVKDIGQWPFGFRTTLLWLKTISTREKAKTFIRYCIGKFRMTRFLHHEKYLFFKRVNYYSTVVPTEHVFLERILGRKVKQIAFHYMGTQNTCVQAFPLVSLHAKRVWVGNSATLTNNHLDVFQRMKGICGGWEVLTPVSYTLAGEVRDPVTEAIETSGERIFGRYYKPIRGFMPFDEYVKLMATCSVFIFAHKRQQSVGNLVIALQCGGCVFMDSDSPVYKYFTSKGFVIYTLSDLKKGLDVVKTDFLSKQSINLRLMNEIRGRDVLIDEIRESVRYLESEVHKNL